MTTRGNREQATGGDADASTVSVGRARPLALYTPILLGVLTLTLTVLLAFESSQLHDADTALREYQALMDEKPQEKLYLAWKMFRYERVLAVQKPPLAQLDEYQKIIDTLRDLSARRQAIAAMLNDARSVWWSRDAAAQTYKAVKPGIEAAFAAHAAEPASVPAPVGLPPDAGRGLSSYDQWLSTHAGAKIESIDCMAGESFLAVAADDDRALRAYVRDIGCFVHTLNIGLALADSLWSNIYAVRAKVQMLVAWVLPGLYGLLGACVYLMRDIVLGHALNRSQRSCSFVAMLGMLLRIALGGLAGIIIGWFWVPASGGASTAISVSSVPFGIAFLAGFSIETLFSLLDRLKKTIDPPGASRLPRGHEAASQGSVR
jgi:hypothetical protein